MRPQERLEALELIHERQADTSSVSVQIGGVREHSGIVDHKCLFIQDAPAAILNTLKDADYRLSVEENGVRVDK